MLIKNFCRTKKISLFSKRSATVALQIKMPIKAALIDLSGTLHIDDEVTHNAVEALKNLRTTGISIRFVTNTTKESSESIYQRLRRIGFDLEKREIYSSLSAAADYVKKHQLNPFYLVSKDARTDFPAEDTNKPMDSVVIGLAIDEFSYENVNKAFNVLMANKANKLIAIHQGKYYKSSSGLAVGPGCYVKGLEYATGTAPVVIGKPNAYFFQSAIPEGIMPNECVMIGDDPNDDVAGAMRIGMKGVQVKTGKYLPDVVIDPPATILVEDFNAAVAWLLENECKT